MPPLFKDDTLRSEKLPEFMKNEEEFKKQLGEFLLT